MTFEPQLSIYLQIFGLIFFVKCDYNSELFPVFSFLSPLIAERANNIQEV